MARVTVPPVADLESEIHDYGMELWRRSGNKVPGVFNKSYWQGRILDWAMRDPEFKIDLFRLIDVLPSLKSSRQLADHIREYLLRPGRELPPVLSGMMKLASGSMGAMLAAPVIRANIADLAGRFILGEDAAKAMPALRKLRKERLAFTVDLLGETTTSLSEAQTCQQRYLDLIDHLAETVCNWNEDELLDNGPVGPIPRANISVKISALGHYLDPSDPQGSVGRLSETILPLLLRAREKNVFVNFDLEQWAIRPITYDLFEELAMSSQLRDWPHLGVVVQAYLVDSQKDVQRMITLARRRGAPLTIRLVKGAYWEYEVAQSRQFGHPFPVFTDKAATDANYEHLTSLLLENIEYVHPTIASHNIRSLTHALVCSRHLHVPSHAIEVQMLYGMAEPLRAAIRDTGYRVRLYCPIGRLLPGVAYLVRRLLENTSNSGFLKLTYHDNTDIAALLEAPCPKDSPPTPPAMVSGDPATPYQSSPLIDFTNASEYHDIISAVTSLPAQFPLAVPIALGGMAPLSRPVQQRFSPNDPDLLVAKTALATVEDAEQAAQIAYEAYPAWRDRLLLDRARLLDRLADLLERDRKQLIALEVWEVAKPIREADADVVEAIDYCRYYARQSMVELQASKAICVTGEDNTILHEGRGPAVIIAPWNFPLAILTGMSTAALVAGNPAILKPSLFSSAIGYALYQRMVEAGFPPQVVQFLPGAGSQVGSRLVDHPLVAQIALTGSKQVGLSILEQAARWQPGQPQVKRVICEMGGKNAIIVDEDADLDEAVAGVMKSAFGYAGQKCSACSRLLVVGAIYETFINRLVEACRSLLITGAQEPSCQLPPVIDPAAQQRLLQIIENPPPGAQLLFKGPAPDKGCFVPSALFAVEDPMHRLMQEELFGPILTVMKVDSFSQALDIAMRVEFFLTGGLFSRTPSHIELASRRFRVGNLYINRGCTGAVVGRQPFGGHGLSGIGTKAGGPGYLPLFADPRVITENTMRRGMAPELNQ